MRGDVGVGGWIPLVVVNAVQDAEEVAAALPQDAFQPIAELGRLDLLGILAAHGRDRVGVYDAALQGN